MNIVVDKSWLTNKNKKDIVNLSASNTLILIDILGYELFSTEKKEQVKHLWKKLLLVKDSVKLTDGTGYFIDYEIKHRKPIKDISQHFLNIDFKPSQHLIDGNAVFSDDESKSMLEYKFHYEDQGVDSYRQLSAGVHNYLPELKNIKKGCHRKSIIHIYEKVANDFDFIKYVYQDSRPTDFPPTKIIDENWFIFRWLQFRFIYGIDYVRKYGVDNLTIYTDKFINTSIDFHYAIFGSIVGALASCDNDLCDLFKIVCPDKYLIK